MNAKLLKEEINRIKFLRSNSKSYYKYHVNINNNQDGNLLNLVNKNFYEMRSQMAKHFQV